MPYLSCLTCGRLSKQSRCPEHRADRLKRYGTVHKAQRKTSIELHPWCANCLHGVDPGTGRCPDKECPRCPLELDHVSPIRGGRLPGDDRRQVLCRVCNRLKG